MILSTLCYIEKDNKYLMLHRTKKKNDISKDKWLGIGGKFEEGESPEECIVREVMEETGLKLNSYQLRTIVTYVSTNWETEYMYVFTSNDFTGNLIECNEGDLQWIDKKEVTKLNTWKEYWFNKDIDRAVALFNKTTFYQETPFMKPYTTIEEINQEWQHVKNENIEKIEIKLLAIDGYTVIAEWILKQNDEEFDGIYEIKFNENLECVYFKSWEMIK